MPVRDFELLSELGFSPYERRTLMALIQQGVADAETLCRLAGVPTSKIYLALEKLASLSLIEVQPTRPKLYSALATDAIFDRLNRIAKEKADRFAEESRSLKEQLTTLPRPAGGHSTFADLALGRDSHVKRHLIHLAAAKNRIWSYLEEGDLAAIDNAATILRRIARNAAERNVDHRVVFGFGYRAAPKLVAFLKKHRAHLDHVTGVRYSGEFGHPFHVVDDDVVILCVDHPFAPEGRVASLMVRDATLAGRLADGFETLWKKAMRDLREISFQPS